MPVVGHFNHKSILATFDPNNGYSIDFNTISNSSLLDMTIPFSWISTRTGMMNGIAGWFDLVFDPCGSEENAIQLSTGPQSDTTHWYQTRFLFSEPLAVKATSVISGWMRCIVNDSRSYTIYAEVVLDGTPSDPNSLFKLGGVDIFLHKDKLHSNSRRGKWELHEQTFNHNFNRG
jgi:histone-arginine methyltransferase CARM1